MNVSKLIDLLNSRGFKASYFDDVDIAMEYIASQVSNTSVGIGGSMTIAELGIQPILESAGNKVFNHAINRSAEVLAGASLAEVYFLSANAISMTGEIVNIDGRGNRIASSVFGPNRKKVFYVLGTNKVEENLEKALFRAKNIAAPKNAKRLSMKTPCAINADKCYDCKSPDRICRATLIHEYPMFGVETHVVIIKGNYGF